MQCEDLLHSTVSPSGLESESEFVPVSESPMCLNHKCEQDLVANSHLIFLPVFRRVGESLCTTTCVQIYQNTILHCCILRQSFIALQNFGEKMRQLNEEYMTGLFSRQETRDSRGLAAR